MLVTSVLAADLAGGLGLYRPTTGYYSALPPVGFFHLSVINIALVTGCRSIELHTQHDLGASLVLFRIRNL